jgi:hypothetical protein
MTIVFESSYCNVTVVSTTLCKSQQWFWDCDGLHNGHFEFVIKFEECHTNQSFWLILDYSIYKWVNWVIQYNTSSYPSLSVTCTILSKCRHTLFNSILAALFYTYVILFIRAIPNSIHEFIKHKDSFHCILEDLFFLSIWICHPNSQSHILKAISLMPYLS